MRCPPGRSGAADPVCRATLDLYQTLIVMSGATAEKRRAATGFDRAGAPTCRAFPATFDAPARINFRHPVTGVTAGANFILAAEVDPRRPRVEMGQRTVAKVGSEMS